MIDLLFNLTYKECMGWENQEKGDNSLTCFILQCTCFMPYYYHHQSQVSCLSVYYASETFNVYCFSACVFYQYQE